MGMTVDGNTRSFVASEAIARGQLVKLASTEKVAVAGLAEAPIGVAETVSTADGDLITVRLLSSTGTINVKAGGAFDAGAAVYGRAAGVVDDIATSSAVPIGIAIKAGVANALTEVAPITR